MSILTRTIGIVKAEVANASSSLQLAYSCKVTEVIAELDPEDLVQLTDSIQRGEYLEVVVYLVLNVNKFM
jgi:hypothetical protein